ncbi:MAG: lipase family protein [Filimonas sp.]|nr:lipase family protein [Filimonas sp.]
MKIWRLLILLPLFSATALYAQQKAFDPAEYLDLLRLNFKAMADTTATQSYSLHKGTYNRLLRSPEVGLYNRVEVFMRNDGVAVVSLRGTINKPQSWLENFFAAMVAANGSIKLNDSTTFSYTLSKDPQAYVHIGWLVGLGHLAPYITHELDSLLQKGTRNIIVMGHSQGGALAFLTTSYLYYHYAQQYPDLKLTAYCSAAPKPGNLYYAYDFDFITRTNGGFRIVNAADWVPETPISIQTIDDFRSPNPLADAKTTIKKESFFVRLALNHVYNKLKGGPETAMKRYRKYLGDMLYKQVKKSLPQFEKPSFVYSSNYMTAGVPIILPADSAYHAKFVFNGKDVFVHHSLKSYEYLVNQYYSIK